MTARDHPTNIFYRLDHNGHAHILHDDGTPATRLPGSWPLGSDLSGSYDHPEGIVLETGRKREKLAAKLRIANAGSSDPPSDDGRA